MLVIAAALLLLLRSLFLSPTICVYLMIKVGSLILVTPPHGEVSPSRNLSSLHLAMNSLPKELYLCLNSLYKIPRFKNGFLFKGGGAARGLGM